MAIERIEDAQTFEEIVEIREGWLREYKRNGDNLQSLLTDLYKEPSHFIYELIQNAEDTGATEVTIDLRADHLVFSHNGKRPFDINDIRSITGIGDTTKKQEDNKIGRFGIGFKSVFGICETPQIYCKNFCFEIHDLRVPRMIEKRAEFAHGTNFVLPFKNKERSVQDIYLSLHKAVEKLDIDTVLFLRNINSILWKTPNLQGSFKKDKSEKTCGNRTYYVCEIKNENRLAAKYLIFEKSLSTNEQLFVSLAYRMTNDAGKSKITMENTTTNLFASFPMNGFDTHLRFKVNGPYATANTRAYLNDKRKSENGAILTETLKLYEDSLYCIKELGLFDLSFLKLLPIDSSLQDQNDHAKAFYDATLDVISSGEFLPTTKGGFTKPSDAILVGSKELSELLSDENDARAVFGRGQWLDATITQSNSNMRIVYDYIRSTLGVPDRDITDFVNNVKDEFVASKDDAWLIAFYALLNENKVIKNRLEKKIIRLESGQMVSPFTNSLPNAFLPSKFKSKKTIKATLCESKEADAFFRYIGLNIADVVEEIRDFINELKSSKDIDDYKVNFLLVYDSYKESSHEQKQMIADILRNETCLLYEREDGTNTNRYAKPTDVFVRYNGIQTLYAGIPDIYYLAKCIAKETEKDGGFQSFLTTIGLNTMIKVKKQSDLLTLDEKAAICPTNIFKKQSDVDYRIEHLEKILATMTEAKSFALWKALDRMDPMIFDGLLSWSYGKAIDSRKFKSYFVRVLQKAEWLYNEHGERVAPSAIYLDDVLKKYPKSKVIAENFEFLPPLDLPPEIKTIVEVTAGIPVDYLIKAVEAYKKEKNENTDFIPIVDATDSNTPITEEAFVNRRENTNESDLEKIEIQNTDGDVTGELDDVLKDLLQETTAIEAEETMPQEFTKKIVARTISDKTRKIGAWGEQRVFTQIQNEFSEKGYGISVESESKVLAIKGSEIISIEHHNKNTEIQPGYDISIRRGNEVLEYIEVKTREEDTKQYFAVSGTQWEFAKTLHKRGEGDKYCVYLVTSAGTEAAETRKFRNPYKNWVEGKLEADPVCIKL